jgi:hypothetical protein
VVCREPETGYESLMNHAERWAGAMAMLERIAQKTNLMAFEALQINIAKEIAESRIVEY